MDADDPLVSLPSPAAASERGWDLDCPEGHLGLGWAGAGCNRVFRAQAPGCTESQSGEVVVIYSFSHKKTSK